MLYPYSLLVHTTRLDRVKVQVVTQAVTQAQTQALRLSKVHRCIVLNLHPHMDDHPSTQQLPLALHPLRPVHPRDLVDHNLHLPTHPILVIQVPHPSLLFRSMTPIAQLHLPKVACVS